MIRILRFLLAFHLNYFKNTHRINFFSFPIAYILVRKPYGICSDTDLHPPSKLTVWFRWSDTSLFWSIQDHWMGTEAVVRAFCVNALAIDAAVGVLTFIHIWKGKKCERKPVISCVSYTYPLCVQIPGAATISLTTHRYPKQSDYKTVTLCWPGK